MRILFIGTGGWGIPALEQLAASRVHQLIGVVTQPDRPGGRGGQMLASPIKEAALRLGITPLQPEKINRRAAVESVRELEPDLIVVAAYGQILSQRLLELPPRGCINLHVSLLPRHRGASPIQAAILAGDAQTGITVIWMNAGVDAGDMILQERLPIGPTDTAETVEAGLAHSAATALGRALPLIDSGAAPRIPQDAAQATYAPKLEKKDGLIDWWRTPVEIDRQIRALTPWPSAYTFVQDSAGTSRQLKIFSVAEVSSVPSGRAGEVLRADGEGLIIGAGDGAVALGDVQLEGKKRMSAVDFLRGFRLTVGTVLGEAGRFLN